MSGLEVYTRVAFCQKCYDEGRPKHDNEFIVYGGKRKKYFYRTVKFRGKRGFVPTFFAKDKVADGHVFFDKCCAMDGCGIVIKELNEMGIKWEFIKDRIQSSKMRIVDWNALTRMSADPQWCL